jgi:hypothetical protein
MRHFLAMTFVLAALPASAHAAPVPGASYGGGIAPRSYADRDVPGSVHVDAHVTPDGARARVRVNVFVRCSDRRYLNQRFDATGAFDAAGRVQARARSRRYRSPGLPATSPGGTGTVDLVFDGARAGGTVRARSTFRSRGRRIRCDSGPTAVELRSVAADPGTPATAAPGGVYLGTLGSSFRGRVTPIAFKVDAAGTRIPAAVFGISLACPRTPEYLANISPSMTIRADGTFRRTERFTSRYADATDRVKVVFAGRFTAAGATGTISVTQRTRLRRGGSFTCRSGNVGWSAVR